MKLTQYSSYERYLRTAHYLAAAQIYLKENVLLREPFQASHIKDRLLGHWGTCPGINLLYTGLNRLILEEKRDILLITGPGHGAPANLANLYLEGSLQDYYPDLTHDVSGLHRFVRAFSWPGGFPSHVYPGVPGTIHEGGELGYALGTAFGAALDNPDLLVACIIGDGEAETGPTAAAWHSTKFLDPRESGAVLPILHLNEYKISNPTLFGSMTEESIISLFSGYGWNPRFITGPDYLNATMEGMTWASAEIRRIQHQARNHHPPERPRWPLLILKSPKGWTGVEEVDGTRVEGTSRAHQVPVEEVKEDEEKRNLLEEWLRSYRPEELFDENGAPSPDILSCCPTGDRRMGSTPHSFGSRVRQPLKLPEWRTRGVNISPDERGKNAIGPTKLLARYLAEVVERNPQSFRLFSPDEFSSNKLDAVFDAPTHRQFQWPQPDADGADHVGPEGGRVMEILSEHTCQAWLQGYLLTGRHGLFPSYESFLPIVSSMMDQYAKFMKMSGEFSWRGPIASMNYLETSTLWRQEHNGFSHQNPGFINTLLNKKGNIMRVYLPPDANCLLSTCNHCLDSTDHVNLIIANKNEMPVWLDPDEAADHCQAGVSTWEWASTFEGADPDAVLVGIGDVPTREVLAAADLLRQDLPDLRLRVVNVTDLLILDHKTYHPHGLDPEQFASFFTADRPVVFNFHGYPSAVEQLLFGRGDGARFRINGYCEEGNTTTPFDMLVQNGTSRYHLAIQIIRAAAPRNATVANKAGKQEKEYNRRLASFQKEILDTGKDPDEITHWKWST